MKKEGVQPNNNCTGTRNRFEQNTEHRGSGICLFLCLFFLPTAIKEGLLEEVTFELAHEEDTGV